MATLPWVNCLDFYEGKEAVQYDRFDNVQRWCNALNERPAVKVGRESGAL